MIGILSDAHGNYRAFEKALVLLSDHGADQIFFLGDSVGYIPTDKVLRYLLEHKEIFCLPGNHEEIVLIGNKNPERETIYRHSAIRAMIGDAAIDYIESWPSKHSVDYPCGRTLFVHGSPSDPLHEYVFADTDLGKYESVDADFIFMGHTHRPFIRHTGSKTFVNIGSCGMPRDCGSKGSVCLFNENTGDVNILRFDITEETKLVLQEVGPVHETVTKLYERTDSVCFGEYIDNK